MISGSSIASSAGNSEQYILSGNWVAHESNWVNEGEGRMASGTGREHSWGRNEKKGERERELPAKNCSEWTSYVT